MKFTIALPITKTQFLNDTLNSIASQTERDFEVIIRNNGRDDKIKNEIKNICADWINKPFVKYYESVDQLGMTQNFNTILEKAQGEFFTVLSDDDVMDSDFLKEFNSLTTKYKDIHVFHCRVKRIDGKDNLIDFSELCPEWESQLDFIYQRLIGKRTLYLSDFVVNTKALKESGGFTYLPKGWGTDEVTWIKLSENGIGFTPKVLLKYRRFLGNFSMSKENLQGRFKDIDIMHEIIDKTIIENCEKNIGIYPKDYLLNLSKKRKQKQYDYILEHCAKSSNLLGILKFYIENKEKLTKSGLSRSLVLKLFYKNKLYYEA